MSEIKVNKISPRTACGTTTLGDSGDTFTIPAGVSITNNGTASGFGATGSVDWITTPVTSTPTTGVSGKGYFVNSTGAIKTINLPASPSAGDIMAVVDYAGTAQSYNITIGRNGSNINGAASNLTISKNNSGVVLVYVDGTQGWKGTETANLNDIEAQPEFIVACGGTVSTSGDYKIHTFTGPGTFTVTQIGNSPSVPSGGPSSVDYLVVAGGGGASGHFGAGGGAGGFRYSEDTYCSPAPAPSKGTALPVTAQAYPITVGSGGAGGPGSNPSEGVNGVNSIFSSITSTGGGRGGDDNNSTAGSGGSGGGGGNASPGFPFGAGNTPPVSPPQGNPGSNGQPAPVSGSWLGGAGGGAAAAGETLSAPSTCGADGGAGYENNIDGTTNFYAGGGGGSGGISGQPAGGGNGGNGGGGGASNQGNGPAGTGGPGRNNGGNGTQGAGQAGGAAGANTGGGGGGASHPCGTGGAGGSGIVIIRYKFQ